MIQAVAEIVKASKREAFLLPTQAELFAGDVKSIISNSAETMQGSELQLFRVLFNSQGIIDLSTKCFLQYVAFFLHSSPLTTMFFPIAMASPSTSGHHSRKFSKFLKISSF